MGEGNEGFGLLLILSEIIITAIAFIGAYFILKPVFMKSAKDLKNPKPEEDKGAEDDQKRQGEDAKDQE